MNKTLIVLVTAAVCLTGCKKSSAPSASNKPGDAVEQKLQELAGSSAKNCGRVANSNDPNSQAQLHSASDCAMQSAKDKQAFYVAYELPGLTVAVAGASDGKLYTVQAQTGTPGQDNAGAAAEPKIASAACPAELRLALSGRVTCLPAGSMGMGSTGGSNPHGGGMMPQAGTENPHGGMTMPPAGTASPHGGGEAQKPPKK